MHPSNLNHPSIVGRTTTSAIWYQKGSRASSPHRLASRAYRSIPEENLPRNNNGLFNILLCVCLIISFTLGVITMNIGYSVMKRLGHVLNKVSYNIPDVVTIQSAVSEAGQNIAPIGDIADNIYLGEWQNTLGFLLCFWALVTMFMALFGFYSSFAQITFMLVMTAVLFMIPCCIMVYLLFVFADLDNTFHDNAVADLKKLLKSHYVVESNNNSFTLALNTVMFWFECCGVTGYTDFDNITFIEKFDGKASVFYSFKVSPACCCRSLYNNKNGPKSPWYNIIDCAINGGRINKRGCYMVVMDNLQSQIVIMIVFLIMWNLLVIVLVILTIKEIQPQDVDTSYTEPSIAIKSSETGLDKVRKFVPTAKESSWVDPDVNRVKSTEIW